MQTKLTVRIDRSLIDSGKKWSRDHGISLSSLISGYLEEIDRRYREPAKPTPVLRKLKGRLKGKPVPTSEDYADFLDDRHR